jgi:hypothetical protein
MRPPRGEPLQDDAPGSGQAQAVVPQLIDIDVSIVAIGQGAHKLV